MQFPIQALPVNRTSITAPAEGAVSQSNCNVLTCAPLIARCGQYCGEAPNSYLCARCLGYAYHHCIGCFDPV